MRNDLICMFMVVICVVFACGRVTDKGGSEKTHFELPVIPAMLGSEEEKTVYLAEHYWDHFDFSDTVLLRNEEVTEQAFADFLSVLNQVPGQVAGKSAGSLLGKAWQADQSAKVGGKDTVTWALYKENFRFDYFTEQFSHYLYDPNSPYRNDALYGVVLQQLLSMPEVPELLKERSRYVYDKLLKNRVGDSATDFYYTAVSGKKKSLYRGGSCVYRVVFLRSGLSGLPGDTGSACSFGGGREDDPKRASGFTGAVCRGGCFALAGESDGNAFGLVAWL